MTKKRTHLLRINDTLANEARKLCAMMEAQGRKISMEAAYQTIVLKNRMTQKEEYGWKI